MSGQSEASRERQSGTSMKTSFSLSAFRRKASQVRLILRCRIGVICLLALLLLGTYPPILERKHSSWAQGTLEEKSDEIDVGRLILDFLTKEKSLEIFRAKKELLRENFQSLAVGFTPMKLVYLIQENDGTVAGKLIFEVRLATEEGFGKLKIAKRYEMSPPIEIIVFFNADDFSPIRASLTYLEEEKKVDADLISEDKPEEDNQETEVRTEDKTQTKPKASRGQSPKHALEAYYYYDTVTVRSIGEDAESVYTFRRPLPSFDVDALSFILGAVAVEELPKKTLWFITSPFESGTHICLAERVGKKVIYAADAEKHITEQLHFTSQNFNADYFVETTPPFRVVKFTLGNYTFTLWEDESSEENIQGGENDSRH